MASPSTASVPMTAEKAPVYQNFGRARLSDLCDNWVIYRNLEPLDQRVPGLKTAFYDMELRSDQIPRKLDRDYAKAAVWFVKQIQRIRGVKTPVAEMLFIGDTLLNDGQAYLNMAALSHWRSSCFIGAERLEQDPVVKIQEDGMYVANRWSALGDWVLWLKEQGFNLDERTAVIIDIDKTALGARGRNDKVIDTARLAGLYRTMDAVLGTDFDQATFERHYSNLNRSRYHQLTTDNQDYLAYICMVLNTDLISFDEVVREVETSSLDSFEQFVRWVNSRMMINQAAGEVLREVHEAVNTSVMNGDPTPFKRFRRQEFLTTLELMGNMPDTAPVDEILREEITLTEEAFELVQWLKERRALILCLSDKPDEASKSSSRYAVDMPPLHRAETHRIGVSILDTLSKF